MWQDRSQHDSLQEREDESTYSEALALSIVGLKDFLPLLGIFSYPIDGVKFGYSWYSHRTCRPFYGQMITLQQSPSEHPYPAEMKTRREPTPTIKRLKRSL